MIDPKAGPRIWEVILLVVLGYAGLMTVGSLVAGTGPLGVTVDEIVFFGLPIVLLARRRGGLGTIGLVAPRGRHVLGAILVGLSGWAVLDAYVLPLQEHFFPVPEDVERQLRELVAPSLPALVAVSIVPAVCEELLFRGGLAYAVSRRFGRTAAVVLSALAFAAGHGPYRFLPTLCLGLSFGAIALRAGSLAPTMLAHALNNGSIWLVTSVPGLEASLTAQGFLVGVIALALAIAGHALVFLRFNPTP